MRHAPPPLLPLLRSPLQGELLAWLFLHPGSEYSQTELATRFDAPLATVSREAGRLAGAGLVHDRRWGNMRLLRANTDTVVSRPLTDLLAVTYGPLPVLSSLLAPVPGVSEALIYGSWAARYSGQPGPVPNDVDVLVIGEADDDELEEAARSAEGMLGRPVHIRRVSQRRWAEAADSFLRTIRSRATANIGLAAPSAA